MNESCHTFEWVMTHSNVWHDAFIYIGTTHTLCDITHPKKKNLEWYLNPRFRVSIPFIRSSLIHLRSQFSGCAQMSAMGWLRLVGSLKLQVSFAEYRRCYRSILQKRPIILRSLLIEATPYHGWLLWTHLIQTLKDQFITHFEFM